MVGGGPVGVPLSIGSPSAILGSLMTGPDPFLFSEAEGGWEEGGTRVTVRSRLVRLIIVACGPRSLGPLTHNVQCGFRFWREMLREV